MLPTLLYVKTIVLIRCNCKPVLFLPVRGLVM